MTEALVIKRDADGKPLGIDFEASAKALALAKSKRAPALLPVEPKRLVVFVRPGEKDVAMEMDAVREMNDAQIDRFLAQKARRQRLAA